MISRRLARRVRVGVRPPALGLAGLVVSWWLLAGGAVMLILPPTSSVTAGAPPLALGQRARIHQPGLSNWPIPTSRLAYDEYYRGAAESDEGAIDDAFAIAEWVATNDGDAVRIVSVDGEAVEIELLDGSYAGRRAWVKLRHLSPAP